MSKLYIDTENPALPKLSLSPAFFCVELDVSERLAARMIRLQAVLDKARDTLEVCSQGWVQKDAAEAALEDLWAEVEALAPLLGGASQGRKQSKRATEAPTSTQSRSTSKSEE